MFLFIYLLLFSLLLIITLVLALDSGQIETWAKKQWDQLKKDDKEKY